MPAIIRHENKRCINFGNKLWINDNAHTYNVNGYPPNQFWLIWNYYNTSSYAECK